MLNTTSLVKINGTRQLITMEREVIMDIPRKKTVLLETVLGTRDVRRIIILRQREQIMILQTSPPCGLFSNTMSYYGAYDMGRNIWEWNSTIIPFFGMVKIQARGGSFRSPCSNLKKESKRFFFAGQIYTGFRIAVPAN